MSGRRIIGALRGVYEWMAGGPIPDRLRVSWVQDGVVRSAEMTWDEYQRWRGRARARTATEAPMSEWLPIETAPRDGTRILVACWEGEQCAWCHYTTVNAFGWVGIGSGYVGTHWMPMLPPPPAPQERQG